MPPTKGPGLLSTRVSASTGGGAFVVNVKLSDRAFVDGMSKTLSSSEVKAYQANGEQ